MAAMPPSRMNLIQDPVIPIVGDLIRQHPGTISLGQGVVNYPPPPQALDRLNRAFADPKNHLYQAVEGIPELRQAIAHKLAQDNQIVLNDRNCVVVTAGSNMAFMNIILTLTEPGDEVILLTPYYFNHEMAIGMASCRTVCVPTDAQYQPQIELIRQAITDRTKAIVTISPNNPTGAVYSKETLWQINQLCRQFGIYHISDEAYDYFTYGVNHHSPAAFSESEAYTISLFSLSKAYGFASWRMGYLVMPVQLIDAFKKVQDTILICPPVASQYAALGALEVGRSYCAERLTAIAQVRDIVLTELSQIPNINLPSANGAFYCFLRVDTPLSAMELVQRLVQEYGVAVIPGDTFGTESSRQNCYLRVAYGALQPDTAIAGIQRLATGLRSLLS
ncbi:MAG: pyridoxal phosphate-dependent aminotransferase [Synechococcales bacterium]|nr:pyridoxal phosphate-dependent aminotransferase [Synechococcales bacterium]